MQTTNQQRSLPIDATERGKRILLSRKDLKINQHQLAERSGVSRGHIAKIERGEVKNPTIDIVYRIADALGVSRAYPLGFTEDPLHELEEYDELQLPALKRNPSGTYRTLGAEMLDMFDQLSTDSQQILLTIADKLRLADAPSRRDEPEDSD